MELLEVQQSVRDPLGDQWPRCVSLEAQQLMGLICLEQATSSFLRVATDARFDGALM